VHTGQGDFGSRHHPEVLLGVMIQVVGKLGKLSGGKQCPTPYHKGCVFFLVSLADVQIEHPGN